MDLRVEPNELALVVIGEVVASLGLVDADFALGAHPCVVVFFFLFSDSSFFFFFFFLWGKAKFCIYGWMIRTVKVLIRMNARLLRRRPTSRIHARRDLGRIILLPPLDEQRDSVFRLRNATQINSSALGC